MDEDRSSRALARITEALMRIEAAASRRSGSDGDQAFAQLQARHQALRTAVTESLEQLDQLIEGSQG